jgi:hypothetical protein
VTPDAVVTGPATADRGAAESNRDWAPESTRRNDLLLRLGGLFVAVVAAVASAVLEVFLVPLRIGTVLIGLSVVLAVLGNLTLVWFTHVVTEWRWAVALPAVAWFAVFLPASGRTAEGDLLLTGNNWVGITTTLAGSTAFAIGASRLILGRRPSDLGPGLGRGFR